ncbi:MAG TPA: PhnD/SsuA/transferrin family substrate-binding protein [Anaerolineales bacterium]
MPLLLLWMIGCGWPIQVGIFASATMTPTPWPSPTAIPPTPEPPVGSEQNPLVLALPPSARPQGDVLNAGNTLTSILKKQTGYEFVSVIPPNEFELVEGFASGDADIASLSPFGYLLANAQGTAEAAFAREQDGGIFYGAEFIAPGELDFLSFFDPIQQANLAEADVALAQFANKKPCWTDEFSPSGYVVPLGILRQAGVTTREPAFLASHPAVVRALYAGGICDFGATYVDAMLYPGLEDELPDVNKRVEVIWRIPEIIPYETLVFSRRLPVEMRRLLTRTFVDLMGTTEGKSAMQTLYGFSAMQVVNDGRYAEFSAAVRASGLNLQQLVER